MFVHTTPPARSPEAQMLAQEIAGLVRTKRMQRPDLPWSDVWMAFAIAREMLAREFGGRARAPLAAAIAVAVLTAIGGAVAFFFAQP
jgi:hypothetical protein